MISLSSIFIFFEGNENLLGLDYLNTDLNGNVEAMQAYSQNSIMFEEKKGRNNVNTKNNNSLVNDAMQTLLQNTRDFMFVKNKDLIYVGSSTAFAIDCVGLNGPQDIVGKTDFEIFEDQSLAEKYRKDDERLIHSGNVIFECREAYPAKDGRKRYCQTTKYVIRDADGNVAGLYGQFRDITEQIELEEMGREKQELLERQRKIFQSMRDIYNIVIFCDLKHDKYDYLVGQPETYLGIQKTGTLSEAMRFCIIKDLDDEMHEENKAFFDPQTMNERLKKVGVLTREFESKKFGWMRVSMIPVERDEAGDICSCVCVSEPIGTEVAQKKELEYALEENKKTTALLKMQKMAGDLIANSKLVNIALLEKKTGMMKILDSIFPERNGVVFDYDVFVQKEEKHLSDKNRQAYRNSMLLQNVLREVSENGSHAVTVNIRGLNHENYLICYHFAEFEENHEYLFVATEDITEQKAFDTLTDNLNMQGFELRVDSQLLNNAEQKQFAILNFNIVNFKAVNSEYGFDTGDWLLLKISDILKKSEMRFEAVCRETADNFFCLARRENITEEALNKICRMELNKENMHTAVQLQCGIYYIEDTGLSVTSMCDRARMSRQKIQESLSEKYHVFDDAMNRTYIDKAYVLGTFDHAMREKQFEVYYQPIFDSETKKIASAEALIRWNHPEKGFMLPSMFLPIIEKSGRMSELDFYVETVIQELLESRIKEGKKVVPIAINLSRYDFLQQEFMDCILEQLQKNRNLCPYIRFEITETGFIHISESGEAFLTGLRDLGCLILIDDFGSGVSSLGTITESKCDILKMDMSFIRNIGKNRPAEAIINATIETSHALNLKVVAEGVETKEQFDFLHGKQCDYIQGYYFAKPMPQKAFEELLDY